MALKPGILTTIATVDCSGNQPSICLMLLLLWGNSIASISVNLSCNLLARPSMCLLECVCELQLSYKSKGFLLSSYELMVCIYKGE